MNENTPKIISSGGIAVDEELKKKLKAAGAARGMKLQEVYDQAFRAWLGEVDPARDAELAEYSRFRKMLADAEANPDSDAGAIVRLFRSKYRGGVSTASSGRAKDKK